MENLDSTINNRRLAMLIDGENAQASLIENMVAETGKYGLITIRRIYGDWTTPEMKSWKDILNTHAIQPIQQFRYTVGKNATDSALIIDSMDILHDGVVNGFCLVSSDSDYTRLATRIREKGLFVMGIGRKTTPRAFVNACEIFVYTENLVTRKAAQPNIPKSIEPGTEIITPDLNAILKNAFDMAVQDDGWASLGMVGTRLRQLDSGFDTRTYGYKQLSQLIKAHNDKFEIREKKNRSGLTQISVRLKDDHS